MVKKIVTKEKALERLEALCNRSEQCVFDLERKLITWKIPSLERKEILESLSQDRLLDDLRFAKAYANDKARFSSWGPQKIRAELIRRKIKSSIIKEALQNVASNIWKEGLLRCAESKSRNLDLKGEGAWENGQKLYRFLIGRGFPSDVSSKAVSLMKKRQEEVEND